MQSILKKLNDDLDSKPKQLTLDQNKQVVVKKESHKDIESAVEQALEKKFGKASSESLASGSRGNFMAVSMPTALSPIPASQPQPKPQQDDFLNQLKAMRESPFSAETISG